MPTRYRWLVLLFYGVASVVLTWPLAANFASHLPAVGGAYDALLHVFLLGWGWQGLTADPLAVFDPPIFYPETRTLTYMDHLLGQAVLAGPIIELWGLGAGYNSLILFSFIASAYFAYRLTRLYGISPSGSCVAGFLFAFCPYRFSHLGCLNQIQTQLIPLGLFFAVRFVRERRTRDALGTALTLAAQSYFGWYATFHLLLALLVLLAWEVLRERGRWRQLPWRKMAGPALLSVGLAAPSALPYLLQRWAMPEFRHPFSETLRLSAGLLDYLRVNSDNILAQLYPPLGRRWAGLFPGLVALGLAAVALVSGLRARLHDLPSEWQRGRPRLLVRARTATASWGQRGFIPVLGLSGLVLSLGPVLQLAGGRLWLPLPYALCYLLIPGFSSMRTPARFAVLVALAAAMLAGIGFDVLRRRFPQFATALLASTLLAAAILAWCPNLPLVAYPDRTSMPPVYEWLAALPDSQPFLEVPVPIRFGGPTDARRQAYVLYHGKPRLDGTSGFTSDRYKAFRREMQAFPARPAVRRALELGATRVIVHYGDYPPEVREQMRGRLEQSTDLRQVVAFGEDVVYAVEDRSSGR